MEKLIDLYATGFVKGMPKSQKKIISKMDEQHQRELIEKVYESCKEKLKKDFIDTVIKLMKEV